MYETLFHNVINVLLITFKVKTKIPGKKSSKPVLNKEFLDIQTTIECKFNLNRVYDMITTCYQMYSTDKYSQHSSIIWPVLLNGQMFAYKHLAVGWSPIAVT